MSSQLNFEESLRVLKQTVIWFVSLDGTVFPLGALKGDCGEKITKIEEVVVSASFKVFVNASCKVVQV